jgi:hypothetical protein
MALVIWGEQAGAEHLGTDLDQAGELFGTDHHLLGTAYHADTGFRRALGLEPNDVGRGGDSLAGGVLVEDFVGADLGRVALRLGDILRNSSASGLHVGYANAITGPTNACPVELAGQANDDATAAIDFQRRGGEFDSLVVVARADLVAVPGVQLQPGGLGLSHRDIRAPPIHVVLRIAQRVHQQLGGVVCRQVAAVDAGRVERRGAGVNRGTELGAWAAHRPMAEDVHVFPSQRTVEEGAPRRGPNVGYGHGITY